MLFNNQKISLELDFWTDNLKAKKILKNISTIEKEIKEFNQLEKIYFDISDDVELLDLGELLSDEMIKRIDLFIDSLSKYETRKLLNGSMMEKVILNLDTVQVKFSDLMQPMNHQKKDLQYY